MIVRNFWIEAHIDGRKVPLKGGPKSKNGGFDMVIRMREEGSISARKAEIKGSAIGDDALQLQLWLDGELLGTLTTER